MNLPSRSSRRNMAFYPSQAASVPNPGQKVYIVDCATCGAFLSSRGMKAVLLLRPHIALYSTDALPVNCSAHAMCSTSKIRSNEGSSQRTCSCLTQTLLCHGCGSPVGYMIVIPCDMCTSSSSADNRTTNNHRFVFHCGVVRAYERLYLTEEPHSLDVLPQLEIKADTNLETRPLDLLPVFSMRDPSFRPRVHLPTPPPDDELSLPMTQSTVSTASPDTQLPSTAEQRISSPIIVRIPSNAPLTGSDYFTRFLPETTHIKAGDVVYWHHLARNGEIPACCDDTRARGKAA